MKAWEINPGSCGRGPNLASLPDEHPTHRISRNGQEPIVDVDQVEAIDTAI
jgi:hypothetical protein